MKRLIIVIGIVLADFAVTILVILWVVKLAK